MPVFKTHGFHVLSFLLVMQHFEKTRNSFFIFNCGKFHSVVQLITTDSRSFLSPPKESRYSLNSYCPFPFSPITQKPFICFVCL